MDEKLGDTIISDQETRRIVVGQKTLIPQMKSWHRAGDCIGMELSCNTVQVNFLEDHIKIIIWAKPHLHDLAITSISTVGTEVRVESSSLLSRPSSLSTRTRAVLGRVQGKVRDLLQ